MEKSFNRSMRIAQELQKNISMIIQFSLKDPRIMTMITVSQVQVSKDLSHAQVFLSFFDKNKKMNIKEILIILNNSTGYIRKLLCKKMRLRIMPIIVFCYDDTLLKGNKISLLLKKN
ncbi:30S ribosome-binding factor RbfA [Buchnera aphidicola (Macrosiphoniella sanborni)]|uniref:Ribosome-binding factor A n=1 Tax=Buchnera aphidicola (Macrosiphoniella sanborni) TaxID=1241865 RepID=A0A4D6Y5R4_9GAMM|nr:30S ribosome-binding factor RbfA [Buchnera aphidicola]QCI23903.1 30S ribosome-binding factor RbfA [Buchnera aphidicola (Macrosiphoniella sanborni)]